MIRKKLWLLAIAVFFLTVSSVMGQGLTDKAVALRESLIQAIDTTDKAPEKVRKFMKEILVPLCTNPIFIAEIRKQNAREFPMEEILRYDTRWKEAEDEIPIITRMLNNTCAKEIRRIVAGHKALGESFVMDKRGANVGQNEVTSDYYQGDEAKWQDTYLKSGIWIGKDALDKSTYTHLQHVSLPIFDEQGEIIGAVCWGIRTSAL